MSNLEEGGQPAVGDGALYALVDGTVNTKVAVRASAAGVLLGGGGGGGGGGGAATISDGSDVVSGSIADAASTAGGAGTESAKLRLMTTQLAAIQTSTGLGATAAKQPALGAAVIASSTPVNIASDQIVPVSAASLPLPAGAATSAKQPALGTATTANSTPVNIASDQIVPANAYITSPGQAPYGLYAKVSAAGAMNVTAPAVPIHFDQFDVAGAPDPVRWTTSGSTLPTNSAGGLLLDLTAANSVSSVAISPQTFTPTLSAFTLSAKLALGSAQTNPNAHRFFGTGVVTSYASATPLTDGFGFEVDLTGALNAVVYIAGTRYVVNSTNPALITGSGSWATDMLLTTYGQTMTWPASGTAIVYCNYYAGIVWFYYGSSVSASFDVPIGFASYVPGQTALPVRVASITTPAVSTVLATTFRASGYVLGGTVSNTVTDATYPFRAVTVKGASTAAVATDLAMVVALHPSTVPAVTVNSTTALTPGTAAANLGKAEDAAAASGDTGIAVWGVRRDTLTSSSSASGDYNEMAVDTYGNMLVKLYEKHARTYSGSVNVAAAAAATDIATLTGSATTTVYITKVIISGVQTTAGLNEVQLVKRSTANTGGTSSGGSLGPHDSADAAATATMLGYTANPTTGTTVYTVRRNYSPIAGVTSVVNPIVVYEFGERGRPIILRGIAQVLAVNLNGATITGGTFDVSFEWFEI